MTAGGKHRQGRGWVRGAAGAPPGAGAGGLRPVIDQVFDFDHAPDAFDRLASGGHFDKVVDRGRLVGVISLKDLMRFLSLKMELEHLGN